MAAYRDHQTLVTMKRLWAESLSDFEPDIILEASKKVVADSDYLPTLNKMRQACSELLFAQLGLPNARDAYLEACNATSPKAEYSWSHAVVYQAGKDTGWRLLASEIERKVFPIFNDEYNKWCHKVVKGEAIPEPTILELPERISKPLSKEEQFKRLDELKKLIGS